MADPITIKALQDASLDAKSLEEVVNGNEVKQVTTRKGETYPSVKKAIKTLFENGGFPATPFATKALMIASALVDGDYAQVTDDTVNNGLYVKTAGSWVKSGYDPLTQAKEYVESYGRLGSIVNEKVSEKLMGVVVYSSGSTSGTDVATPEKYSYVFKVKPSTTYTVYSKANAAIQMLAFYDARPASFLTKTVANGVANPVFTVVPTKGRYYTFTTSATTNFVVFDQKEYIGKGFEVRAESYFIDGFDGDNIVFERTLEVDNLIVGNIESSSFGKSRNLASYNYTSGVYHDPKFNIGQVYPAIRAVTNVDPAKITGMYFDLEPSTTYTISKDPSNFFSVSIAVDGGTSGRILFRDSSKSSFTFTTAANERRAFVSLSNMGEKPLVQLEKGSEATNYIAPLPLFDSNIISHDKPLGGIPYQTENTYIDLGVQTDKFRYPLEANTYDTSTILNEYYEPLLADFPHLVKKNLLSKDTSGLYDIYEYVFEPDAYEQTILITSGMHPTEVVPPFAVGMLMNEIYRNPSKHEGLAYLRNRVKIVVIPVVNVWGMNQNPKTQPEHYGTVNGVNPSRNFPSRWEVNPITNAYDLKGTAPLSENESKNIYNVLVREKDELSFSLDTHTGEGWVMDSMAYYLDEDSFLRPEINKVVSMQKDIVRASGRIPVTEVRETWRATNLYYTWHVLGIPAATIEYGGKSHTALSSEQTTYYVNQVFNFVHYALKAKLKDKIKQAKNNEHNKPFISLYNTLAGHNNVVNEIWTYAQWQTNLYDKLGLTRSVMGAASGAYELVKYTHSPSSYKNTVVLSAGLNNNRKAVTELGFIAHKLMTDKNPHIVALRASTRFVFIPCLNPHGFDKNTVNNANAVQPFVDFGTSTQPEAIALRSFIDAGNVDLYIDMDSSINTSKPAGYTNLQVIFNNKADAVYQSIFSVLNNKYGITSPSNAKPVADLAPRSPLTTYINTKPIAYEYVYIAQNVLPKRTTEEGLYVDYGYEADELAYNAEVILNSIKALNEKLMLVKYLSA